MKQTTYAVDTLFTAPHPHLYKHVSVFKILLSSLIALGGVAALVFSSVWGKSNDTLSMISLTVGIILLVVAFYRFFWQSYEIVYRPTGSVISSGSLYMDSVELQHIRHMHHGDSVVQCLLKVYLQELLQIHLELKFAYERHQQY